MLVGRATLLLPCGAVMQLETSEWDRGAAACMRILAASLISAIVYFQGHSDPPI
jgi:hypothetical protein